MAETMTESGFAVHGFVRLGISTPGMTAVEPGGAPYRPPRGAPGCSTLPCDLGGSSLSVTGLRRPSVARPRDAAELLDVHVHQLARAGPLAGDRCLHRGT